MTMHNLVAKASDWHYSSWIDHPTPELKVPKMVRDLQDHLTVSYSAVLHSLGRRVAKHHSRPTDCKFGSTHGSPTPKLSCAVAAIFTLVH